MKIKVYVELTDSKVIVPDWVKTEEELENFADEYASQNMSSGFDIIEE